MKYIIVKVRKNLFKAVMYKEAIKKKYLEEYFHTQFSAKKLIEGGDIESINEYYVKRLNKNKAKNFKDLSELKGKGFIWTGYEWKWYNNSCST